MHMTGGTGDAECRGGAPRANRSATSTASPLLPVPQQSHLASQNNNNSNNNSNSNNSHQPCLPAIDTTRVRTGVAKLLVVIL
jgi:hypothetical protein